ncbi:uncharacterized protein [Nicotiana sylvestris]|uniref:uncharacterized protein n=1 Tax=Nicotiana sylvestris TaxID=4096 RepID=UPI00388C79B5
MVNQLAGCNFMKLSYDEACDILDEMAETSSAWQIRSNVPKAKAQLQQVQNPCQVNAMKGVNMLVNKRRQRGQQNQGNSEQFDNDCSGFQNDGFDEQNEEAQYVNNYQGQRGNSSNQEQWRPKGNWGNHQQQGNGNWVNNNQNSNWGNQSNNKNSNWGNLNNNQNNQGSWNGNNNNCGSNNNQGGWNNGNQGNQGQGFQSPPMYQQPNNPPPFPSQGPSSSSNDKGIIEMMFKQMIKKNADSDAQLASHNTSIRNL